MFHSTDQLQSSIGSYTDCLRLNSFHSLVHCFSTNQKSLFFFFLFVHAYSSAGIGRTGCVAAILNGLRQLRLSYLSSSTSSSLNASDSTIKHASVDILGIVSNLRLQRGGMVQNSEQYELIHRALCLYHQRYLSK